LRAGSKDGLNTGRNAQKEGLPVPRRGNIPKREIFPDAVYDSVLLQTFINKLMVEGKKSKAEKIVYRALEEVGKRTQQEPLKVFIRAIENTAPLLQVKARRVGGATYQIPVEVTKARGQALAMQWVRQVSRTRKGKSMIENLAAELIDASNGVGGAIKMKEDVHKTAEANKAFSHFRW
jgi:small subunit ribosomal protein S7